MQRKIKLILSLLTGIIISNNTFAQHSVKVKIGEQVYTVSGDTTKQNFKATIAKLESRFSDAANHKIKAIEKDEIEDLKTAYYEIACFYGKDKEHNKAANYLKKSIDNGWSDLAHLEHDADLESLRKTSHWNKITPSIKKYYKTNNKELAKLFAEDQHARLSGKKVENLTQKDSIRRTKVMQFLKAKKVNSTDDYYKAAMILHHGNSIKHYKLAHELALKSYNKDDKHYMSPWLVAATKDRFLLKKGEKQWYGTQDMKFVNGKPALDPSKIDTSAVSDQRRKKLNAPSIEQIRIYIKAFSKE